MGLEKVYEASCHVCVLTQPHMTLCITDGEKQLGQTLSLEEVKAHLADTDVKVGNPA